MSLIAVTIISNIVWPALVGFWSQKNKKKINELVKVMKICDTPNDQLKQIAVDEGLKLAGKTINKLL